MHRVRTILALTSIAGALAGSAHAAPSDERGPVVTVAPLRGKGGGACAKKLAGLLGQFIEIEPWDDTRGVAGFESFSALSRFIEARGKALGADIVVVGTLRKKKLILEAYDVRQGALLNLAKVPLSQKLPGCTVGRNGRRLVLGFADRAVEAYGRRQRVAARAPKLAPPPRVKTATPAASPPALAATPPPAASSSVAAASPPPSAAPETEAPFDGAEAVLRDAPARRRPSPVAAEQAQRERAASGPVWVEIDPEIGLSQRSVTFEDPNGVAVATYQIGAMFTPGLRARVRPFAGLEGWLQPLEAEVGFRQSPTFSSRRVSEGAVVDTRYSEVVGLLRYPIRIPKSRFSVSPELGGHFMQYSLRGQAGGASSLDTPSTTFESLVLGLGIEAPVVEQADVRLSGAYLPVLAGGQVFQSNYYPEGSAWALRVEAALTVHVTSWLLVVVTGHYTGYSLDLARDDEGRPAKASDRTTGLRLGLRFAL